MGNGSDLAYQYKIQDRLMQLTYQLLGRPVPTLPSERLSLITREEVDGLAARLQMVR